MLVTLRQLQYAVAVAETGSFSKAAKLCHAEQSTISQQIRTLEQNLNIQIFDRTAIPVKITDPGSALIEQAKSILEKVDNLTLPFRKPSLRESKSAVYSEAKVNI